MFELLSESNKKIIKDLAEKVKSEEVCGLIVDNIAFECKNVSIEPSKNFVLSPLDYIKTAKKGKIQAIFHSHIGDKINSSLIDRDTSSKHNLPIITYNVKFNTFNIFSQNLGISYSGKSFKLGKSDCFTLLREYYYEEFGIEIPEVKDIFKYFSGSPLFNEPRLFGFYEIESREQNDVLISKDGKRNHILIYLGYNKVLHQPMNAESLIQDLNEEMESKIVKTLRHESFIRKN
jgi:proteasome lid subunit RPN8/RPN11